MNAPTNAIQHLRIAVIDNLRLQLERAGIDLLDIIKQGNEARKGKPHERLKSYHKYDPKTNLRTCKCGRVLPWTSEHFACLNKATNSLDFRCKICRADINSLFKKKKAKYKKCLECFEVKLINTNNFEFIRKRGMGNQWADTCKKCRDIQRNALPTMFKKGERVNA